MIKSILFILFGFYTTAACTQPLKFKDETIAGKLSLDKIAARLEIHLKDSTVGWAYQIRKNGKITNKNEGGYKITGVDRLDGKPVAFDADTRMHVASVSKTITAVAVAKLVEQGKLSWGDKIKKYLPLNWKINPLFENTTIADLLTMRSGLDGNLDGISSCYDSLQVCIARGPDKNKIGKFNYQNISYGLLRIIIAEALGPDEFETNSTNSVNSVLTTNKYINFVNRYLFGPLAIKEVFCAETEGTPVLMYPFPYNNQHGYITGRGGHYNDGNLSSYAGALGWYISINELSVFLNGVFYEDKIINQKTLDELIKLDFPFKINSLNFGQYFGSGGDWMSPQGQEPRGGVHAYYYFFPSDIQITVFVNSGSRGLKQTILGSFMEALYN